jgi:hypothetical protein
VGFGAVNKKITMVRTNFFDSTNKGFWNIFGDMGGVV